MLKGPARPRAGRCEPRHPAGCFVSNIGRPRDPEGNCRGATNRQTPGREQTAGLAREALAALTSVSDTRGLRPTGPSVCGSSRPHWPVTGLPVCRPGSRVSPTAQERDKGNGSCPRRRLASPTGPGPPLASLPPAGRIPGLRGPTSRVPPSLAPSLGPAFPLPPPALARAQWNKESDGACIRALLGLSGLTMAHFW